MNIPLINSLSINDINTSLIAIIKNMQKTSSGTEKLQDVDVDVNVNIAHNSLYCAADSTVIKGATLFQGCSIKVLFTSAITGSDTSTPLVINYNDVNIPVKTGKNGTLADFVAYNTGSAFVYCQAYTTLELLFDGNNFVIMGNPVVISNSDYTVYTDGLIEHCQTKTITTSIDRTFGAIWGSYAYSINTYLPENLNIIKSDIITIKSADKEVFFEFGKSGNEDVIWFLSYLSITNVTITLLRVTKGYQ